MQLTQLYLIEDNTKFGLLLKGFWLESMQYQGV